MQAMGRPSRRALIPLVAALIVAGCGAPPSPDAAPAEDDAVPPSPPPAGPYVRVLGTVQDGGLPHAACNHELCRRARHDPSLRRRVASLALVLPASSEVYLIDATPDLREQLDLLADVRRPPADRVDRAPVSGVLLTHAHVGHYLGLAFFGFEAVNTRDLPLHCTPRMAAFLRANGPWNQLVTKANVALVEHPPGSSFPLGEVTVEVLAVPHRDEYSDTVGYVLRGPQRTLLYVPDTDAFDAWPEPLPAVVARLGIDVAILDATFYSLDELPGRDLSSVPHPLVTSSMDLLQELIGGGRLAVYFTHLNHSNPALDPASAARREIERRGFAVLQEGQEIAL
ncbi:MAG: MBL fold metallo-hydrolase [Acidobacteria bacterium]|nr:MAG: MBL fold metallo-hydrolase [Acidobacteriota bacterium]